MSGDMSGMSEIERVVGRSSRQRQAISSRASRGWFFSCGD